MPLGVKYLVVKFRCRSVSLFVHLYPPATRKRRWCYIL